MFRQKQIEENKAQSAAMPAKKTKLNKNDEEAFPSLPGGPPKNTSTSIGSGNTQTTGK